MRKNKEKFKIGIKILILIIFMITILLIILKKRNMSSNIKDIIEGYGSTFYSIQSSEEKDYKKDINVLFNVDPIEENGVTNQYYYERIIAEISSKMNKKNYRIVDEDRNMIIRVKYNENGSVKYSINNEYNYFDYLNQQYTIQNAINEDEFEIDLTINSSLLNSLIENNWKRKKSISQSDTIESRCDEYDYYFDEGYKIRTINSQVYNIIYTKQYKGNVVNDITTQMDNFDIMEKLGSPLYMNNSYELIGYKTKDFYIFFYDGEISIYKNEVFNEEENKKFAELFTNYLNTSDYEAFINDLKELYPDYSEYKNDDKEIKITYPNKGFIITVGNQHNYMEVYSNYRGLLNNEVTIDNLKNDGKTINGIKMYADKNLIFQEEIYRTMQDSNRRNLQFDIRPEELNTLYVIGKKFTIIKENNIYKVYSKDKENIDSEFQIDENIYIYEYNDNTFIYGIKNKGIYYYNAETGNNGTIILDEEGECKIKKIEEQNIYYDEKIVPLNLN